MNDVSMQLVSAPLRKSSTMLRRAVLAATIGSMLCAISAWPSMASAKKPGVSRNRSMVSYIAAMGGLSIGMGGVATENLPMVVTGLTVAGITTVVMIKDLQKTLKDRAAAVMQAGDPKDTDDSPKRHSWLAINFGKVTFAAKSLLKKKSSDFSDLPPGPRDLNP